MSEEKPDQELEKLDRRLRQARGEARERPPAGGANTQSPGSALGLALRVGVELVSALAIGLAIGWLLDKWLDTRPWLMLVFIFLGGGAGILNVYRMARGFGYAVGYKQDQETGDDKPGTKGSGNGG